MNLMTINELGELLCRLAADFDDASYPGDVYFEMLKRVRLAYTPAELANALALGLAWKDGKVRRDPNGEGVLKRSSARYRVSTTRPNTLDARHLKILASKSFFTWAMRVKSMATFEPGLIRALHRFGLWSSVVIPGFLLHCLNPHVYPIVDRRVIYAHLKLTGALAHRSPSITISRYAAYRAWWLQLSTSMGRAPGSVTIESLKEIDSGLWVYGRRAAQSEESNARGAEGRLSNHGHINQSFKELCFALHNIGMTQRKAMEAAAAHLNVELKPSHLKHPGSHFHRWRQQGFVLR